MATKTPAEPYIAFSDGNYLAVIDLKSPANRAGHYEEGEAFSWDFDGPGSGKPMSGSAEHDFDKSIKRTRQYWALQAEKGDILSWPAGESFYKVKLDLITDAAPKTFPSAQNTAFLGKRDVPWTLNCPSGRLAIISLKGLGTPDLKEVWTLEPGSYRAGLEEIDAETRRHAFIKTAADYPDGEGPDFILHLQRIS